MTDISQGQRRLDAIDAPAILLSLDHRILATNKAYEERYGIRPVGRSCFAVSHGYDSPCDQNGETCPVKACRATGRPTHVHHAHLVPGGTEHCDIELLPVTDAEGEIEMFIEVLRPDELAAPKPRHGLVGSSAAIRELQDLIDRVAPSELPVLITGETGTGKELVAQAVHRASTRANASLVPVECPGVAESLFESELFGHERGAFTGADRRTEGLVGAASKGTLFLDEIGDLSPNLQVKLLRLLEAGTYRRVGSTRPLRADIRLIAATHRDLKQAMKEGRFRSDLYYRLAAFPLHLPPLRERAEDIPELVAHFLADDAWTVTPAAVERLQAWTWPGNVRELRNVLERARLLAAPGSVVDVAHLPEELRRERPHPAPAAAPRELRPLAEVEHDYLRWALSLGLSREELAQQLGLSLRSLYRKLSVL